MVDTGSQLNLIKESALGPDTVVNPNVVVHITGVGKGTVRTFGEVTMSFKNVYTKLHIVDDAFPINGNGILGVPFLNSQNAKLIVGDIEIPFKQTPNFDLPQRTRTFIRVPVENPEVKCGYVKRIDAGGGLYLGERLVEQIDGFAYI